MEYRVLGRTGWQVSEIGCGTYRSFDQAGRSGQANVLHLMRENLAAGVNLFDSAPMYGHSEANIGAVMGTLRGEGLADPPPYIATKVLQHDLAGARRQVAHSFEVIGGRIDLLQIHNMAGWREILPWLHELKQEGRIGATGVTHYAPSAFDEIEAAMRTGLADVIQVPYNLAERTVERRLLPLAHEMGLGVLVMTPIHPQHRRGTLTSPLAKLDLARYADHGVTDAGSLCLKWLLSKDARVVPIPATSRPERVHSNAAVSGTPPLRPEAMQAIERALGG